MGGIFSAPEITTTPEPTDFQNPVSTSSSQTPISPTEEEKGHQVPKSLEKSTQEDEKEEEKVEEGTGHQVSEPLEKSTQKDEEEEEECGFCRFMKGGPCKSSFIDWEKCVAVGELMKEDVIDKCAKETRALMRCVEAHPEYYAVVTEAEDKESAAVGAEDGADSAPTLGREPEPEPEEKKQASHDTS